MRALRASIPPFARAAALEALEHQLIRWIEASSRRPPDGVIGLFAPGPTEAGPTRLGARLRAAGWTTAYPRVDRTGDTLTFRQVMADSDLTPGWRGLLEPSPEASPLGPEAFAIVLVPGLAFDPFGGRVGQGGGHYDRFLSKLPRAALRVGVGFACQVLPRVPTDAWDEALDVIITDVGPSSSGLSPAVFE